MSQLVRIIDGEYKKGGVPCDVNGMVFELTKGFVLGARGGYITVDSTDNPGFPDRNIRIMVEDESCYQHVDSDELPEESTETDEEIMERMRIKFDMLEDLTAACKTGAIRAMIVSGPPGVGKSYGVEKVLAPHDLLVRLGGDKKVDFVKGTISPIGLYCKLYEYSDRASILVFDDCDAVFDEPLALNILKAALDSKERRTISWNTDSYKLKNDDVPDQFEFKGSVIFITNIKFGEVRSKKLRDHIQALESRCHYIDLAIDRERDKMLRIRQVVSDGMLESYDFSDETVEDIMHFIDDNRARLRELSLRTVIKTADLVKAFPNNWANVSQATLMKPGR